MFASTVPALRRRPHGDRLGHAGARAQRRAGRRRPAVLDAGVPRHMLAPRLDGVGAERAVVLGHSLGGYLSLELALAHPDASQRSCSSTPGPATATTSPATAGSAMATDYAVDLEAKGLDGLPGRAELRPAASTPSAAGAARRARKVLTPARQPRHRAGCRRSPRRRSSSSGPTTPPFVKGLALHGRQDPARRARRHRRLRPRPPVTHPEPFNAAAAPYLEGLS